MAFATEAQNEGHASSGQKRKAADDVSQEEQCRKEEHSARDMWTLRQAERIIHLYNQLGSRWKRSVSKTAAFLCDSFADCVCCSVVLGWYSDADSLQHGCIHLSRTASESMHITGSSVGQIRTSFLVYLSASSLNVSPHAGPHIRQLHN